MCYIGLPLSWRGSEAVSESAFEAAHCKILLILVSVLLMNQNFILGIFFQLFQKPNECFVFI